MTDSGVKEMQELGAAAQSDDTNFQFFQTAVTMRKVNSEKKKNEVLDESAEGLGDILRNARIKAGLELTDIHQQTKISASNLRAMEEGRYKDMPAPSFCRGFYKIYAQTVGLDSEKIAESFQQEWQHFFKGNQNSSFFSFERQGEEIDAIAGRPSLLAFSSIGVILLLLTFFTAFLCWFFSWNPALFLSQKLRSFDHAPTLEERFSPMPTVADNMATSVGNPLPLLSQKGYTKTDYQNAIALMTPYVHVKPFDYLVASADMYPLACPPAGYLSESFAQYLTVSLRSNGR